VFVRALSTNQKGAIAEASIAREAIKLGIGVLRPDADERFDFIFDLRPRLVRVQCKSALLRVTS
jgi:PD-(D/E)XK endonuclease